ncbi:bifunctional UDP-N-acetylglucosamine diphosphorylase/glucosamine-1-phosphate N-acetyltransferase GlmU [Pseudemcibacter aquimaris]|uniref:bifunctional UDP-N-acetylglucosamine diphosphorylase/glucosamine-1-phosphate N-acetyltransferase GlmU n=1 Tax=Pseudemcibacter aquimaris TaxID=2857064 RepID=UPI00201247B3|nr:bifunctional UDP-N-acetylglucosamine diphosphorylase/glucosamine-1-phosphate N-acetyltransferase GlmU [Pseudemcibacter aquimaris]MCC3859703.1 bifunctional UDP-N-acetylglucosamine diphosphorylase/glucosamine-1-phosphate N-acetyltransferase GlmU [Pseudemcibacter aquimaris]WDU60098.1 bifunctional UDP-N-acetylglucosamine diphosphorylase/glucosamine-1-phosphate N-acetyltransferase GlmU [Pseudemcibacter aquimaris]
MSNNDIAVVILAAGKGTRMKSSKHKVLHPIGGRPMLHHLLDNVDVLNPDKKVIVVGADKEQVENSVGDQAEVVVQEPQLGTGHAVQMSREALSGFTGRVLVLYGDVPLVSVDTMRNMINTDADVVVLGFTPDDAKAYGRLKVNENGGLDAIVEFKDANEEERAIKLCNSGIMAVSGKYLFEMLDAVSNDNAAGEYYLTDLVEIAGSKNLKCAVVHADEEEVTGINSRSELAAVEKKFQQSKRNHFMAEGVTMLDPDTVYFAYDTKVGKDVVIGPNVFFGPGVTIADNVTINAFTHIEGATVDEGASIGPFARLRPNANIGKKVKVGNFVEIKKANIEEGAKISHLSYVGDARVGKNANIGAGTITCNYDGYFKYHTDIGEGAFIGSNSSLVAPVNIGDGAIIGAGSVITSVVEADALAITRAKQRALGGWAAKFRITQQDKKNK